MHKLLKGFLSKIRFIALFVGFPVLLVVILLIIFVSVRILPKVPHIVGHVVRDRKPVPGLAVKYISVPCRDNRKGTAIQADSKTGNDGQFEVPGSKELRFIVPLPADYITCWRLCFQESGKETKCWEVEVFGPPSPPEFFEIDCDLNSENVCKVTKSSYEYFYNRLEE